MSKIHLHIVIMIINILQYHTNTINKFRNFKQVVKKIKSCKTKNLEKSIRVNGYIDHNEKTQNETILRCPKYIPEISKSDQKDQILQIQES